MEIKAVAPKPTNMPSAMRISMKGKATVMPATARNVQRPAHEDAVDVEVEGLGQEADHGRGSELQQQGGDVLFAQTLGSIHDDAHLGSVAGSGVGGAPRVGLGPTQAVPDFITSLRRGTALSGGRVFFCVIFSLEQETFDLPR